jgi:hypothetical protein
MGIHKENATCSYWESSFSDRNAQHRFTRFMPLRRFQLLFRRLRIFDTAALQQQQQQQGRGRGRPRQQQQQQQHQRPEDLMPKVYRQVNEWSARIQNVSTSLYQPGSRLDVDECMVRFIPLSARRLQSDSADVDIRAWQPIRSSLVPLLLSDWWLALVRCGPVTSLLSDWSVSRAQWDRIPVRDNHAAACCSASLKITKESRRQATITGGHGMKVTRTHCFASMLRKYALPNAQLSCGRKSLNNCFCSSADW